MLLPNRWRVSVIHADGSPGMAFFCSTPGELARVLGALGAGHVSYVVDEYAA